MKFAVVALLLLSAVACGRPKSTLPTCDASLEGELLPAPSATPPYAQSDLLVCTKLPGGTFAWAAPIHVR